MKTKQSAIIMFTILMIMNIVISAQSKETFNLREANLSDRMTYHRAIDAAVWAMPLMNFKFYRDALADAGVGPNDTGYYSKLQDWKFQTATPNNTTPYILNYWTVADGPIVVEIPGSEDDVGIFGTIMAGGATPENLAKAMALTKQVKIYPLAQADNPPRNKYVDLYGTLLEMTPKLDGSIYKEIHAMIEEEVVLDRDLTMMGLLARLGIKKGEPFKPTAKMQAMFDKAGPEVLEYLIEQYHRGGLNPWMWEGKKWSSLVPEPGSRETEWRYEFPSYYDYHARGALYYAIITSVKNYGTATFYLDIAETPDGEWFDGGKNYKLVMPANVPVKDFWSITTYDLETASYVRNVKKSSIDSTMKEVKQNTDGSVDIYFGPNAPKGKESNWLPTDPKRRFFMLARFYGPKPELYDGNFQLNNMELIK